MPGRGKSQLQAMAKGEVSVEPVQRSVRLEAAWELLDRQHDLAELGMGVGVEVLDVNLRMVSLPEHDCCRCSHGQNSEPAEDVRDRTVDSFFNDLSVVADKHQYNQ